MSIEVLENKKSMCCGTKREIEQRAYFKWLEANAPEGDGVDFWLAAENEVLTEKSQNAETCCQN